MLRLPAAAIAHPEAAKPTPNAAPTPSSMTDVLISNGTNCRCPDYPISLPVSFPVVRCSSSRGCIDGFLQHVFRGTPPPCNSNSLVIATVGVGTVLIPYFGVAITKGGGYLPRGNTGLSKHGDPMSPHFCLLKQNLARVWTGGEG